MDHHVLRCLKKLWNAWGTAANNVYAVGDTGTLLHFDGSNWSTIPLGYTNNLYAIWGTGANDIFVTGGSGIIFHYDGSTWSPMTSGTLYALRGVWGSSSTRDDMDQNDQRRNLHVQRCLGYSRQQCLCGWVKWHHPKV
ncbi:MAG: hypothetical protein IPK16_06255 [Anaerolineales bacterium]|nr:hypothetical protein [Anaerolineales bacterium]